tara:strand:+ start:257 stop:1339 length:1083 start_codon:yes stop_codon:yes gene_type:complete
LDLSDRLQIQISPSGNSRIQRLLSQKINSKTKPYGALGFLEDIAIQVGLIFQTTSPKLKKPTLLVFASDHGIMEEGISEFSKELTPQLVLNFLHEGSAVNVFARNSRMAVKLIDVGVDHSFEGTMTYWLNHGTKVQSRKVGMGTRNFLEFPAMTTSDTERAINIGQKLVADEQQKGCNTIGFGDIAVGSFCSGLAITCAMLDKNPKSMLTSESEDLNEHQQLLASIISKVLRKHPKTHDPLTILALYGGYEIATMVGAILESAKLRMLVLIDGFIASVALLIAGKLSPNVLDYCLICQKSGDKAHEVLLTQLNKRPILDLDVSIGEGCGVALALPLVQNALGFLSDMSTFDELGGAKPID